MRINTITHEDERFKYGVTTEEDGSFVTKFMIWKGREVKYQPYVLNEKEKKDIYRRQFLYAKEPEFIELLHRMRKKYYDSLSEEGKKNYKPNRYPYEEEGFWD